MIVEDGRGEGVLIVGDNEFPVTYGLTVTQSRGIRDGAGQIIGSEAALFAAFEGDRCRLRLGDGRTAPIVVTRYGTGTGVAEFQLAGAVAAPNE
jgi:hypothetical protein